MTFMVGVLKVIIVSNEGDRGLVDSDVLTLLARAACDMAKKEHESGRLRSNVLMGKITTEYNTVGVGQFYGIKFTANVEYVNGDKAKVVYLVKKSLLERGEEAGSEWVWTPGQPTYEISSEDVHQTVDRSKMN